MTDMTTGERAWVLTKSRAVMEATVTNMRAARELPFAYVPHERPRSGMYVCVGAGPSLSQTGPELARMQREGALICTVNTALSAVNRYCVPDVVLAREVVDVSEHMRHPAGLRVLDLSASPKVWAAAREAGPCAWFVAGGSQYFQLADTYGVRPLFGGPAAMTALVALCEQWGAASIVLMGCDLAIAPDGRGYAEGTPFDGFTVADDGTASGDGVRSALHEASGIARQPERYALIDVPAWGGGTVKTLGTHKEQIDWLENFARRRPRLRCIDATGAGARKPGWIEKGIGAGWVASMDFASAFGASSTGMRHHALPVVAALPPEAHGAARAHVLEECNRAETIAVNIMHPEGCVVAVPGMVRGHDLVDACAAADILRAVEGGLSTRERIEAIYGEALPGAARRLRELAT